MSKKGNYSGGSTVIRPGSSWFGNGEAKGLSTKESQEVRFETYLRAVREGREVAQFSVIKAEEELSDRSSRQEQGYTRASRLSPEEELTAKARRRAEKAQGLELKQNAAAEFVSAFKVERKPKKKVVRKKFARE